MRLEGTVFQGDSRLGMTTVDVPEVSASFAHNLDEALLMLCKQLNIPLPIWLKKNTREFVRFRQTAFFPDQFEEAVTFSQFMIKLLAD